MTKYFTWIMLVLMLGACNTISGVGKDLEKGLNNLKVILEK